MRSIMRHNLSQDGVRLARTLKNQLFIDDFGGREGIRTPGLLVANSGENKLRQGATIT